MKPPVALRFGWFLFVQLSHMPLQHCHLILHLFHLGLHLLGLPLQEII